MTIPFIEISTTRTIHLNDKSFLKNCYTQIRTTISNDQYIKYSTNSGLTAQGDESIIE